MPTSSENVVTIQTTDSPLVAPSPRRRGLLFIPPLTNRYTVSTNPVATLDQGITLYPGQVPVLLAGEDYGDLAQRAWHGISAVAAQAVTFYEIFE
jgi:hypothetical protein